MVPISIPARSTYLNRDTARSPSVTDFACIRNIACSCGGMSSAGARSRSNWSIGLASILLPLGGKATSVWTWRCRTTANILKRWPCKGRKLWQSCSRRSTEGTLPKWRTSSPVCIQILVTKADHAPGPASQSTSAFANVNDLNRADLIKASAPRQTPTVQRGPRAHVSALRTLSAQSAQDGLKRTTTSASQPPESRMS